jgi:hypothetical protein
MLAVRRKSDDFRQGEVSWIKLGAAPNQGHQILWAVDAGLKFVKLLDQYGVDLFRVFVNEASEEKSGPMPSPLPRTST